jgi:hypothetical protein
VLEGCTTERPEKNGQKEKIQGKKERVTQLQDTKAATHQVFAGAAMRKHQQCDGVSNRNSLSHSSGGWNSKIKISVALIPSKGWEEKSVVCLSPNFW